MILMDLKLIYLLTVLIVVVRDVFYTIGHILMPLYILTKNIANIGTQKLWNRLRRT